jgi:predicted O-methyltransferase YrrM
MNIEEAENEVQEEEVKKVSETAYEVSDWLTYITRAEVDALKAIVNSLPPDPVVVNIGAGAGTSALAIMEARDDVILTTIDINLESNPFGCLDGEMVALENAGFLPRAIEENRYFQIHGDSKEIGETSHSNRLRGVDFVFVDGDHSYKGVRGDIRVWGRRVRSGGIIAVHDYNKTELYLQTQRQSYSSLSEEHYRKIKPWFHVDNGVDDLLLGRFDKILHIDTLIAFRI